MPASKVASRIARTGLRWLYLVHRWVGIFTCLLCAIWLISGLVMMYVPFPSLTEGERAAAAQPLDWSQVRASPQVALKAAGLADFPDQMRLEMAGGEPVYRITQGKARYAVTAADGQAITSVTAARASAIAGRFAHAQAAAPTLIVRDQWTVAQGFNPHRPLYRTPIEGKGGRTVYVSSRTGEVVLETTRAERAWNWVGSVPHWIYFTELRRSASAWRQVVLWTSGPALVGAISGIWVGLLRLRLRRRYGQGRISPYRGWMKWHHIGGLVSGLFLTTWIFSGWLSVNPNHWFDRSPTDPQARVRYAGHSRPSFPDLTPAFQRAPPVSSARFTWVDGQPVVTLVDAKLGERALDPASARPLDLAARIARASRALIPGAPIASARLLTSEDAYWYSHHRQRRLPVLRVKLGDEHATWFHIDPATGEILGRVDRSGRTYRWLFNALHQFDFKVLLGARPAWDVVVWLLSAGGLLIAISGVAIGWRRLVRKAAVRAPAPRALPARVARAASPLAG